jgi:hypothetical protein
MCASCSSVGFILASTFGGIGVTISTFLSNYQTPSTSYLYSAFTMGTVFSQ